MSRWWRAETGIFLGLWLYLSWLGQVQFLQDPGPYWSTVIGQHILAEGRAPHKEEFSCSLHGKPWNSHQWLSQVVMALLHKIGGLDTLVFATAVLLAALYTWVAHRLIRAGLHWLPTLAILFLTVMASRYHFLARPLLFSIVLLGWTYSQLVDCEAGKIPLRRLFWLPPVFVLWSNLHGGALGGLGTLTLIVSGWLAAWPLKLNSPVHCAREAGIALAVLVGSWLAVLVNPYGWELPRDWMALMGSPILSRYISEHRPLEYGNPLHLAVLFFGLVYLLALTNLTSYRQLRVSWFLPLVWLLLTIQRIRHCSLFSITTAVALAEVLPQTRIAAALVQLGSPFFVQPTQQAPRTAGWGAYVLPVLLVVTGLMCQWTGLQVPFLGRGWTVTDPGLTPTELMPTIEQHSQPRDAVFNDLAYGGFLIYYEPQLRVFVDDRCELYGDAFLQDYFDTNLAFLKASAQDLPRMNDLERWEKQYGVTFRLALVIKTSGFDRYLASRPDRWEKIGETQGRYATLLLPGAVLYARREAPPP